MQRLIFTIFLATFATRAAVLGQTCLIYKPPKNGALACLEYQPGSPMCVAMCKKDYDFVFDPPYLYFCSAGQWYFYANPGDAYSRQLPWPDCAITANKSVFKDRPEYAQFYFDGDDAKDPNVQTVIKNNYIFLMTSAGKVPPFFCTSRPWDCRAENVDVFAGALTV